ncbi:pyrroloquinoline quinone precursor peptide PqqA [Jiella sp. MQZ13P-4]|uniref:Coenzyme PQQ synthesis protein A n=1 Tax=Jiella sonneratiae TaxID=2816856 RepID=A0ABS3JA57_9HYPH|nr:pyrroloquinoline quinone precursor peptide PqqA [Jiella sonneratiae]
MTHSPLCCCRVGDCIGPWSSAGRRRDEPETGRHSMAWNKPIVTEVCMAMEINGYMPVEF